MEGIMRRWIPHAILLTIWVGLLSLITWLDLHNAFLIFAQHNSLLMFPTYWIVLGVLVGIPFSPLLLFWKRGLPHVLRIPVVIGVLWLLALPFIPSTTGKALLMQSNRIQRGMTKAEVRTIMGSYRTKPHGYTRANGVEGLTFCYDVCDITAEVDFVSGQVVRVWYDLD
jgi:hypothetical protein